MRSKGRSLETSITCGFHSLILEGLVLVDQQDLNALGLQKYGRRYASEASSKNHYTNVSKGR